MDNNLTKEYPADFIATWDGCSHLDCLPGCRHGLESGHCERLEKAFAEYQKSKGLPLDVECPRCSAGIGRSCVSHSITGTWAARTHAVRWKAVGIDKPTHEDRSRDYWDFKKREQERILAAHPRRQDALSRS